MGYTTVFEGRISITPPLNQAEVRYLNRFAGSRRMLRDRGPYYAEPGNDFGQTRSADIIEYNNPPHGQPGLWCQWIPTEDGTALEWNGGEKFYDPVEWMQYLIDHFLKPGALASKDSKGQSHEFLSFTFDHVLNGKIKARGEDFGDIWELLVVDNIVHHQQGWTNET